MDHLFISSLLGLLTVFPLGLFVYLQNRKQKANLLWFIYSCSLTVWCIFSMFIATTDDPLKALWYWRLTMALGVIWMPVLFYHFAYLYAPFTEKRKLIFSYVITTAIAISAFTDLYIPNVVWKFDSVYYATPGIAFYILTIWWFVMTGYSHTKLYKDSKTMPTERQNQIKYFILASVIGYLGGLHNFSVVFGFPIYPWGNFLIIVYPFIMTYAIVKHGLFDIFVFIKKIFYTALLVGGVSLVIGALFSVNEYLEHNFHVPIWVSPLLAGILTAIIVYLFLENSKKVEKVKDEFITVAAHKLRTPLTHIGYIADELSDAKTDSEIKSLATNLKEANDRLVDLVNKLLDVTNLETRSDNYDLHKVDIVALTKDVLKLGQKLSDHKNIKVNFKASQDILNVEGFEKSLSFVIQSLFENAVIYTNQNGNIDIDIIKDRDNVIFSIKDSGIGISKEDMEKVFEKFFRSSNALEQDTEGTGLALFMSNNIIKRQGGVMKAESEGVGKGTRFWFSISAYK